MLVGATYSAGDKGDATARAVLALRLDREAVRLCGDLEGAGVASLLLKGPVLQRWLYPGVLRAYADIDLLIPPTHASSANEVLRTLGYIDPLPRGSLAERAQHARNFVSPDGCVLDLHTTLSGAKANPEEVWRMLVHECEKLALPGGYVHVPRREALLAIVVLHAAQHGHDEEKPMEDLRRAAETIGVDELKGAARLADEIGASESFAAGLRLSPRMLQMMPEWVKSPRTPLVVARAASRYKRPGVRPYLHATSGPLSARWRFVWRHVWPTGEYLRLWARLPLDERPGWRWYVSARSRRWAYQVRHIPAAFKEIQKLRRDVRNG